MSGVPDGSPGPLAGSVMERASRPGYRDLLTPGIRVGLLVLTALVGVGTLGYRFLEGWSWLDALYMTLITLSTVGFGEVHPLSSGARVFTMGLILVGVGTAGFLLSQVGQVILERQVLNVFRFQRGMREVRRMKQHILICGYGRLGRFVAQRLASHGVPFVVIDHDPEGIREAEAAGYTAILGDATEEDTLSLARVEEARALAALLPDDADNLYLTLTAKGMNPGIRVFAKVVDERAEKRFLRAGADRLVAPYQLTAERIAMGLLNPSLVEFVDLVVSQKTRLFHVEVFQLPPDAPLAGTSLAGARVRDRARVIVLAVQRGESFFFNPDPSMPLQAGDTLWVLGESSEIDRFEQHFIRGNGIP